jgi:hypothetical protein
MTFFFDPRQIAIDLATSDGELVGQVIDRAITRGKRADDPCQALGLAVSLGMSTHTGLVRCFGFLKRHERWSRLYHLLVVTAVYPCLRSGRESAVGERGVCEAEVGGFSLMQALSISDGI